MSEISNQKVLLSPLDWGLGHAARCIPIIKDLLKNNNQVYVYAHLHLQQFLALRFNSLTFITDTRSSFSYGLEGLQKSQLIAAAFKLRSQIKKENRECNRLCDEIKPDCVISDNRYGFYCHGIRSILITHQLRPIVPKPFGFLKNRIYRFLDRQHKHFNNIWIPDRKQSPGLAGCLSHPQIEISNTKYINILSRFSGIDLSKNLITPESVLIIASGPEKHRNEMAKIALNFVEKCRHITIIGVNNNLKSEKRIHFIEQPSDAKIEQLLISSEIIISRSGYSTLMDLISIGRSAILIPTPGQTEQEYLAGLNSRFMVIAANWKEAILFLENKEKLLLELSMKQQNILEFNNTVF